MKWSVGIKITSGYILAVAILLIIGLASYQSIHSLRVSADKAEEIFAQISDLEHILEHLTDAETGERGYVITGSEAYLDIYDEGVNQLSGNIQRMKEDLKGNPTQLQKLAELEPLIQEKLDVAKEIVDARRNQGFQAAKLLVESNRGKEVMGEIRDIIEEMDAEFTALLSEEEGKSHEISKSSTNVIVYGIVSSVIVLSLVGYFITRNITGPLKEVTTIAENIANGELNGKLTYMNRNDELGKLSKSFAKMLTSLQSMTKEIIEGVNILAAAASEIMATTAQVASGAMETGTAISETTASIEQMKQSAKLTSEKVLAVSNATNDTVNVSENGLIAVEQSIDGMSHIQDQVESIAQSLVRLSEQSQAIGEIITSVNDLAEQSNLLAVNAAIEAAKAGEQGKGFAVVAQEVKILAEQSKEATSQVRTILNDILKATNSAVMSTEEGSKAVETGVLQSQRAGGTIRQMAEHVEHAAQSALQISVMSQQQLSGIEQIALAMGNIRQASEQNIDGTKQVELTVQDLHELGQRLKLQVDKFKL